MRDRSEKRRVVWIFVAVQGVLLGAVMTVVVWVDTGDWRRAAVFGVLIGIIGGVISGLLMSRFYLGSQAAIDGISPEVDLRQANRAAVRGAVPRDDATRRAAADLASHKLDEIARIRVLGFAAAGVLFALTIVTAVTSSGWSRAYPLVPAFFAILLTWWPRHLRRRRDVLQGDEPAP